MLVLARQLHEKIIIPAIQAAIEVVAIRQGSVRLGIEAPPEVTVLREEVARRPKPADKPPPARSESLGAEARLAALEHVLRNRLNNIALGIAVLRRQMQNDPQPALSLTLDSMESELESLAQDLRGRPAEHDRDLPATHHGPAPRRKEPRPCTVRSGPRRTRQKRG
jgi:carbon storage regulator CsrA